VHWSHATYTCLVLSALQVSCCALLYIHSTKCCALLYTLSTKCTASLVLCFVLHSCELLSGTLGRLQTSSLFLSLFLCIRSTVIMSIIVMWFSELDLRMFVHCDRHETLWGSKVPVHWKVLKHAGSPAAYNAWNDHFLLIIWALLTVTKCHFILTFHINTSY
jgi:hypothetical protein